MNKRKSMHEKIIDKIEGLRKRIEMGYPLPGGQKMIDQKAEKELLEIADWYNGDVSDISCSMIEKLIKAFEKCKELSFWDIDTKKELEKTINNLKEREDWFYYVSSYDLHDYPEEEQLKLIKSIKDANKKGIHIDIIKRIQTD